VKAGDSMQDFYLIRHGETDWNIKLGKLQGHSDIPLNEKGILQAKALSELIVELKLNKIVSSDLSRAIGTAEYMSNFQSNIEIHQDLREVHLGIGEGLTWDDVTAKLGADFRANWAANHEAHMDLRFPEGESRREVLKRVTGCLTHYLKTHPGETIAFVSHGFVIRTLIFHLAKVEQHFYVPNCAIVPFAFKNGEIIYKGPRAPEQLIQPRIEA